MTVKSTNKQKIKLNKKYADKNTNGIMGAKEIKEKIGPFSNFLAAEEDAENVRIPETSVFIDSSWNERKTLENLEKQKRRRMC